MKIQPHQSMNHPQNTPCHKKTADDFRFGQLLNERMQNGGIASLVKDAFTDIKPELMREIAYMTQDETGQSIEMDVLDDLLNLLEEMK